jgi:hypothetical protein
MKLFQNSSQGKGRRKEEEKKKGADLVGDRAAHARDEHNTPTVPEPSHLLACSLRSEQHAVDVDVHDLPIRAHESFSREAKALDQTDLTELGSWVLEAIRVRFENTSSSNAGVHPPFLVAYMPTNLPHLILPQKTFQHPSTHHPWLERKTTTTTESHLVGHITTDILQPTLAARLAGPSQPLCVLLHSLPLVRGLLGQVDAVHRPRPCLDEGERHLESQTAVAARDERDAVREGELVREDGGRGSRVYQRLRKQSGEAK